MRRAVLRLAAGLLGVVGAAAHADYATGVAALQAKQYDVASRELTGALEGGEARAAVPLAQMYLAGAGVARDPARAADLLRTASGAGVGPAMRQLAGLYAQGVGVAQDSAQARHWAEQAVTAGESGAHFDYYAIHTADPRFRWLGKDGKPDIAKYNALAARPAAERQDDVRALQHLAAGAAAGDPRARMTLGVVHFETVGRDSIARARAAFAASGGKLPPPYDRLPRVLAEIAGRGPTQASGKSFLDAAKAGLMQVQIMMMKKDREAKLTSCRDIGLPRVESSSPVQDAVHLPLQDKALADAYLLSGHWTERWTYTACAVDYPVKVLFAADGLGGARFSIEEAR